MAEPQTPLSFSVLGFALRLAYQIAVPLILLVIAGVAADRRYHTSPWLLLAGIGLSLVTSAWAVYRSVKPILTDKPSAPRPPHGNLTGR